MARCRLTVSRPSMSKRSLYDNFSRPRILLVKKSLDRFYLVNEVIRPIFRRPNLTRNAPTQQRGQKVGLWKLEPTQKLRSSWSVADEAF